MSDRKCDYCPEPATSLAGETNGVLVCEGHVRLFAEREIAREHDPRCYQRTGVPDDMPANLCDCRVLRAIESKSGEVAMTATIRPMPRPRGELSDETLGLLGLRFLDMATAEALYRQAVLAALAEGSFSAVSEATGLSTNTLQRWKRESGK